MIHGIGTDIVAIARMARPVARYGERFAQRVLAEAELAEFRAARDKPRFLAKRFAAKEALAKALGTGFSGGVALHEIAVSHDEAGRPLLVLSGRTQAIAAAAGVTATFLSIADERDHAIAFVTLTRNH